MKLFLLTLIFLFSNQVFSYGLGEYSDRQILREAHKRGYSCNSGSHVIVHFRCSNYRLKVETYDISGRLLSEFDQFQGADCESVKTNLQSYFYKNQVTKPTTIAFCANYRMYKINISEEYGIKELSNEFIGSDCSKHAKEFNDLFVD